MITIVNYNNRDSKENIKLDNAYYNFVTHISNFFDGLVILDNKGKIRFHKAFNPKGFKVNEADSIGKTPMEVFDVTEENSALYRAYKYGESRLNEIEEVKFRDGQEFLARNDNFPIFDNGKVIGAITVTRILDSSINKSTINLSKMTTTYKDTPYNINDIIGNSNEIQVLKDKICKVSKTNSNILIYGETGTGKELVAQSIHKSSSKKKGYFISQNCAAIPDTLLESIFFGTTKGSFTGAEDKPGIFELANGGTILLDEINSMSLNMQAKLLKAIEDKKIMRIGDSKQKNIDVRIIAAINKKPNECIKENLLRKDFYYRLSSIQLIVPPLRDRKSDIPLLTEHFIKYFKREMKVNINNASDAVYGIFENYDWPGNIRELKNVIESAFNFSTTNTINVEDLPETVFESGFSWDIDNYNTNSKINLSDTIESFEKDIIISKSKYSRNLADLADTLGISKQNLNYKLKKYSLNL